MHPVTPIIPSNLALLLKGHADASFLVDGFTFSFHIPHFPIPWQSSHRNYASAHKNPTFLVDYIGKELAAGRIAGPFDYPPPGVFFSPLGLMPKHDPDDFRVIHDLSIPKGRGVNDLIPNELTSVQYEDFDHVMRLIQLAGPYAWISKVDIKHAFRIMLIHPDDVHLFGFH